MSTADDFRKLFAAVPSHTNGMTLCAGSLGSNAQNDVVAMAKEFGARVHFAHLRNVKREPDGSFFEADHLAGETDMVRLGRGADGGGGPPPSGGTRRRRNPDAP
jgi:mannonate dehydratase